MNRIDNILKWISTATDFDVFKIADMIRSNRFEFHGTLQNYELNSVLTDAIKAYMEGDEYASLYKLHCFIIKVISIGIDDYSAASVAKYCDILQGSVEHLRTCEQADKEWREIVKEELGDFYNEQDKFNAYSVFKVKSNIGGNYLRLYRYAGDGSNISGVRRFKIADAIVASTNISELITANADDDWRVAIGIFIEKKIALSYFVISLSRNGNVYILTDKYDYTNPDQIYMLRDGSRASEEREYNLDLPYDIIDEIKDRRQNNKTVATTANETTVERYVFDIKDYIGWNIYYLIKYAVEHIVLGSVDIPSINRLALTDGNVDMTDDSNFCQTNIEDLSEVVAEIYGESSTELAVPTSQILAANNISTELMTVKDIERHSQYLAHKSVAIAHDAQKYGFTPKSDNDNWSEYKQKEQDILSMFHSQFDELKCIFRDKTDMLLQVLFCGNSVYLEDIDHPMYCNGFCQAPSPRREKIFINDSFTFDATISSDKCLVCGDKVKKDRYYRTMHFNRYTEIATLLGITRAQLPSYFRDYLADRYIPYYGNNILENVKPEFVALSKDYVSGRFPNSFDITFPFCGKCRKSLFKQYKIAEEALVVISSKRGNILNIEPYKS